ncbi:MAG TPA: CBS domain-containing protein [Candidatus Nitrosotalea sp.]|nr:CBS domain-containing protein [Candidatus Nitrosotalea sp.]
MNLNTKGLLVGNYMSDYPISVKPDVSLSDAIDFMADSRFATLIVMEEESPTPMGILTEREIVHHVAVGEKIEGKKVRDIQLRQYVTVTPDTSVVEAARLMISAKSRILVFADGDKLVGTITASDMLKAFGETKKSPGLENVISKKVYHCPYDTTILDAAKLLDEKNIGSILVENETGFGIFTQRDLVRAISKGVSMTEKVGRYSSFPLVTARRGIMANEAASIMATNNIKRLGLAENDSIVGIVTARDVVDAYQAEAHWDV